MGRQDVEILHQKASESYLQGDYPAALELWRELQAQAPEDERAQEGIRLCEMMSPAATQVDPDTLQGKALELDALAQASTRPGVEPDLPGSEPGFDLEAVSAEEAAPGFIPAGESAETDDDDMDFNLDTSILEEMDDPAGQGEPDAPLEEDVEEVIQQLDSMPNADEAIDAAATAELNKRLDDLLSQARSAFQEDRLDEAQGILARLFVLDENHPEARALEQEMEAQASKQVFEIEDKLAEAVQWIEQGRLEEAESNLRRVLDLSPGHQEAEHYLEKTLQLMEQEEEEPAGGGNLPLGSLDGNSSPVEEPGSPDSIDPADAALCHGVVELDDSTSSSIGLAGGSAAPDMEEPEEVSESEFPAVDTENAGTVAGPPTAGGTGNRNRILLAVLLTAAVLAAGGYFGRNLWQGDAGKDASPGVEAAAEGTGAEEKSGAAEAPAGRSTRELLEQADQLSGTAEPSGAGEIESHSDQAGLVEQARNLMEAGRFGDAILVWNQVLKNDPAHPEALKGIEAAGRGYREEQSRLEDLRKAEMIFQEGDYSSALKILYRLPENLRPDLALQYKVNGWYNLGVIALKAGRIDKSLSHFAEIQALAPEDQEAASLREFATRYKTREKDRAFYRKVNDLEFRDLRYGL